MRAYVLSALVFLAPQDKQPLESLAPVADHLNKGVAKFLESKGIEESFAPWKLQYPKRPSATSEASARKQLKELGAVSARHFSFEWRLDLYKGDQRVFALNLGVFSDGKEVRLGSAKKGRPTRKAMPASKLKGTAAAIGKAALALADSLRAGKPVPLVGRKHLEAHVPPTLLKRVPKSLDEAHAETKKVLAEVRDLEFDEVRVALDEQFFSIYTADGKIVDAWLRGKMSLDKDGNLLFRLRADPVEQFDP